MADYLMSEQMVHDCEKFMIFYAILVFCGGLMGFIKAKSKASLIASSIIATVIVGLVYVALEVNQMFGLGSLMVLSLILMVMFKGKWDKSAQTSDLAAPLDGQAPSKKFMPFGLLTCMSLVAVIWLCLSLAAIVKGS
mmetsp:Transcript_139821/g.447158  ORF Transcript_139821/g.447158 Transcript_139821/m.447158 type:complete len:137 (+) Transcript_139821:185-595(+)